MIWYIEIYTIIQKFGVGKNFTNSLLLFSPSLQYHFDNKNTVKTVILWIINAIKNNYFLF